MNILVAVATSLAFLAHTFVRSWRVMCADFKEMSLK